MAVREDFTPEQQAQAKAAEAARGSMTAAEWHGSQAQAPFVGGGAGPLGPAQPAAMAGQPAEDPRVREILSRYEATAQQQFPYDAVAQKRYLNYMVASHLPGDLRRQGINPAAYEVTAPAITPDELVSSLPYKGLESVARGHPDPAIRAAAQRRLETMQPNIVQQKAYAGAGPSYAEKISGIKTAPSMPAQQQTIFLKAESYGMAPRTVKVLNETATVVDVYREPAFAVVSDPFEEARQQQQAIVDIVNAATFQTTFKTIETKSAEGRERLERGDEPIRVTSEVTADFIMQDLPFVAPLYQFGAGALTGNVKRMSENALGAGLSMLVWVAPFIKIKPKQVTTVGVGYYETETGLVKVQGKMLTGVKSGLTGSNTYYTSDFVSASKAVPKGQVSRGMALVQTGKAGAAKDVLSVQKNIAKEIFEDAYIVAGQSKNYKAAGKTIALSSENLFLGGVKTIEMPASAGNIVSIGKFGSTTAKGMQKSDILVMLKPKPDIDLGDITGGGYKVISGGAERAAKVQTGVITQNLQKQLTEVATVKAPTILLPVTPAPAKIIMSSETEARQQTIIRRQKAAGQASIVSGMAMLRLETEQRTAQQQEPIVTTGMGLETSQAGATSTGLLLRIVQVPVSEQLQRQLLRTETRTTYDTTHVMPPPPPVVPVPFGGAGFPFVFPPFGASFGFGGGRQKGSTMLVRNPIGSNPLGFPQRPQRKAPSRRAARAAPMLVKIPQPRKGFLEELGLTL